MKKYAFLCKETNGEYRVKTSKSIQAAKKWCKENNAQFIDSKEIESDDWGIVVAVMTQLQKKHGLKKVGCSVKIRL